MGRENNRGRTGEHIDPIHLRNERASSVQVRDMLAEHTTIIEGVMGVDWRLLADGGQMAAECESILLAQDSAQAEVWAQIGVIASPTL